MPLIVSPQTLTRHAKPGPKSYLEKSKKPKGMGFKARMIHRYITQVKSKASRDADRKGFHAMWKYAPKLLRKWKVPRPGQFEKSNIHNGVLWGGYAEWRNKPITAKRMGQLFEECALNEECSDSTLCQISKCMSFLYLLETGEIKKNWKTLPGLKTTLAKRKRVKTVHTVTAEHIPSPQQLIHAFTTEWKSGNKDMPLLKFLVGVVMAWDSHVLGARPKVDIGKIKKSYEHKFGEDWWFTGFVDGRAKLPLEKNGTRPWSAWRICLCKGGKHVPPPVNFEYSFRDDGNSTMSLDGLTTTCPVFAGQTLKRLQDHLDLPFRCYRKPLIGRQRWKRARGLFGESNIDKVVEEVKKWFAFQGVEPVSSNAGRKCAALWFSRAEAPYPEILLIIGDLERVWRANYQPDLPPSGGYDGRKQSMAPHIATAAIRRFRKLCKRNPPPVPPPQGLTEKRDQVFLMFARRMGCEQEFREIWSQDDFKSQT